MIVDVKINPDIVTDDTILFFVSGQPASYSKRFKKIYIHLKNSETQINNQSYTQKSDRWVKK